MGRIKPRHPPLDALGNSLWDHGDEAPGFHRDWDGVLRSSQWWRAYYKPRGTVAIPESSWPHARQVRTQYRQGLITTATAALLLGVANATAHRFVTGMRYWWI